MAAEVGFKQFVVTLNPSTKWLIENLPSPPLPVMLTQYLPLLPVKSLIKDRPIEIPSELIEKLKASVTFRNEVVMVEDFPLSTRQRKRP